MKAWVISLFVVPCVWKRTAPRQEGGPYPDVARVPPGGLELLK